MGMVPTSLASKANLIIQNGAHLNHLIEHSIIHLQEQVGRPVMHIMTRMEIIIIEYLK